MSTKDDFTESTDASYSSDVVLKKPSPILFFLGLLSVIFGIALGVFGLWKINTSTNSQEYLIGISGYIFNALVPIVILQILHSSHQNASRNNHEEPYDSYAGELNLNRFKKIVFAGLIMAALSIWVFLQPIAEKFAS